MPLVHLHIMDDDSTKVLNFKARLISDYPEDRRRQFMVSYYLTDKTMAIFEAAVQNSGFRSGKFLQRTRVRDPKTNKFFEPGAFFIGAKIQASGRIFELLDAAPHTLNLMEAHADDFPDSDLTIIVDSLIEVAKKAPKPLVQLFQAKDPTKSGFVTVEEASQILSAFAPNLSRQAVITVTRGFSETGRFDYNSILSYFPK